MYTNQMTHEEASKQAKKPSQLNKQTYETNKIRSLSLSWCRIRADPGSSKGLRKGIVTSSYRYTITTTATK